jgi:1,3-beta-galactosyl-N-acetylhexosamine phosphorylase
MKKAGITLPVEAGKEVFSLKMAKELNADAIRNSDGTDLPKELIGNDYGKGRAVYLVGLPFSFGNSHLLYYAACWVAGREAEWTNWLSHNMNTECVMFPATGFLAVANNASSSQQTLITGEDNEQIDVTLSPYELKWIEVKKKV